MLHCKNSKWDPLFPARVLPEWCERLLDDDTAIVDTSAVLTNESIFFLLLEIQRGVRTVASLSRRNDSDVRVTKPLLDCMVRYGLITDAYRITKSGLDFIYAKRRKNPVPYDFSLYIPSMWRIDQEETQPSVMGGVTPRSQTDPM